MKIKGTFYRYLNRVGWLFIMPAVALYCAFMVYPILSSLFIVTRKWKGFNNTFVGLGNFIRMSHDGIFWQALSHNFLFMAIQVPLMILLALVLAVILNQGIRRYRGTFRVLFFLPCVASLVAYSVIFRMLLQTNGLFNNLALNLGLLTKAIPWLSDPFWAKVTIILALTWRWTGYNMVFFLVGLQNIETDIFEAAEVDGASQARKFFSITIPLLVPVILFSAVTSTSGTMQLFDEPNILTWEGGPSNETMTAALYIYRQAFILNSDFGYATALSYVIVVISGILAYVQIRLLGEEGLMAVVTYGSFGRFILWILLLIGAFLCVFPFIWMVIGTTLNPNDVVRGVIIPGGEFGLNWMKAVKNNNLLLYFYNSVKIALLTVVFGVAVNALAAFGFEKYRSRAREAVFAVLLLALIIPQIALVLPQFRLVAYFKLLDTHAAIILPSVMSVFIIFFMRQNFRMFPNEIMEAARVDGASESRIFVGIVFPSMKASFASAAIYVFILQWNSYLWPLMTILGNTKKTLTIAISSMMRVYTIEYGALMIVVCLSVLPILVMFLAMQRQFVAGLLGSVK